MRLPSLRKEDGSKCSEDEGGTNDAPLREVEAQREGASWGPRSTAAKKEGEDEPIEKASSVGDRGERAPGGVRGGGLGGQHQCLGGRAGAPKRTTGSPDPSRRLNRGPGRPRPRHRPPGDDVVDGDAGGDEITGGEGGDYLGGGRGPDEIGGGLYAATGNRESFYRISLH